MDMDKQTYRRYADARAPRSSSPRNCLRAFWVGGTVCLVGQSLCDLYTGICSMSREDGGTLASITLVLISVVLTGLGVFDRIAKHWFPSRDLPTLSPPQPSTHAPRV